jgi:hypothetical protein
LVGIGDLTVKAACCIAGGFTNIAELKIHSDIS